MARNPFPEGSPPGGRSGACPSGRAVVPSCETLQFGGKTGIRALGGTGSVADNHVVRIVAERHTIHQGLAPYVKGSFVGFFAGLAADDERRDPVYLPVCRGQDAAGGADDFDERQVVVRKFERVDPGGT